MAYKVAAFNGKSERRFTLEQVLRNDEAWVDALSRHVWERIRSAPILKQVKDIHERLENVERKLGRVDDKLDVLLQQQNERNDNGRR